MVWGVDGGGTSTRGIAQLGQDCYTDIMSASASNILVVGQDAAFAAMDAVLDRLETSVALNSGSGLLGLAGCDRVAVRQAWREYCLKRGLKRIWITGDYWLPWANFTHGEDGLVAILGTGSVVFGLHHTHTIRLGGYGWKLGDPGSGLSVGQLAVKKAVQSWEGIEEPSVLVEKGLAFFGVQSMVDVMERLYEPAYPLRQLADFAPFVFEAAAQGDEVAEKVLLEERSRILEMVHTAIDKLGLSAGSVGLSGGMSRLWHPYLQNRLGILKNGAHFELITRQAVYGALWLAEKWNQERRPYDTQEHYSQ
ncbi:MAG: hypothetical protein C7B43_02235 [Sulfobacillus benefaciens]|uniref:ATPase BadF/BadG/BcrA/BcrD type domain-containing protein n=1 Tax=Sulfobacillus benefaciens TaxID=453960 RepID=A0A2T2XAL0_9FIRM|nr:MAG: hypothetical protein C7B43_02235 [Sulfobacillus benefaciens]